MSDARRGGPAAREHDDAGVGGDAARTPGDLDRVALEDDVGVDPLDPYPCARLFKGVGVSSLN